MHPVQQTLTPDASWCPSACRFALRVRKDYPPRLTPDRPFTRAQALGSGHRRACRGGRPSASGGSLLREMTAQPAEKAPAAKSASAAYMARHLSVLEGLEAVRKRPGMYIGSTDSRGLMHCVWEIIDNAVDEALAGHGSRIEVLLRADGSVEVRDDGRGIPVDVEPKTGLTGVEVVMTRLHAGGKFGGGSYAASGGLHGVGASVVNALSSRLDVEVDRDGEDPRRCRSAAGCPAPSTGTDPTAPFVEATGQACAVDWPGGPEGHRHPGPLLGGPERLPARGARRARGAARTRPADGLPGARADAGRPRRARRRAGRGDVPLLRRYLRVLRVPGARPGRQRRAAAARVRTLPRDRAGAGRAGPHDAAARSSASWSSTSPCAGGPATTPSSARSSTSSRPPRAAPTSRASSGP